MSDKAEIIVAGVIGGILLFGVVIPIWQMGILKDNAENVSDAIQTGAENIKDIDYSNLLEAGKIACSIDEIVISEMKKSAVHQEMLLNVGEREQGILHDWITYDELSRCDVAILNDMFPNDSTGNIWRNQIGISSAMKNIQACTIVECVDEYGLIELLKKEE